MKIIDILNQNRLSLSFEVFPPKTETAFESVKSAVEQIARLKPAFMSVTYGAGGGTSKYTLEIAQRIEMLHDVPTLAHLTCVSSTRETIAQKIREIKACGIENVMALRGDIPQDLLEADRSGWDYRHAVDLVRELKAADPDFCIGGACYPEVHPESANQEEDILHLKEKADAGCDFLTTQMFFDNDLMYEFLDKVRQAGIGVPVIPGIMPITNVSQIERVVKLSGSYLPQRFKNLLDMYGDDPAAMKQAGIAYATDQIIDLYANGIRNVHVYSMNKPDVAESIQANLSDILGK